MAAQYELYLCDDRGRRLMPLNNLASFSASRIINGVGGFSATLKSPSDLRTLQNYHYIENNIRADWQVQVWRKIRGPMKMWWSYFIQSWSWSQDEGGDQRFEIGGYGLNHLLTRRIVAAFAESAQSAMTDYADDMMKAVVTDSMEDNALPVPTAGTREWGDLTVAGNTSKGPSITLGFAWDRLLTLEGNGVLTQIANASREAGGPEILFFVVPNTLSAKAVTYKFITVPDAYRDLTSGKGKVVFAPATGTLANWSLSYDHSKEVNYVYALGQGLEADRTVEQVSDEARYKSSYWGRREGYADVSNLEDDQVEAAGYDALSAGRPAVRVRGTPVSRRGQEYGRHYDIGDKVIVQAKSHKFPALVSAAVVSQDEDGKITETTRLDFRD